jgi:hypothetical protein
MTSHRRHHNFKAIMFLLRLGSSIQGPPRTGKHRVIGPIVIMPYGNHWPVG